MLKSKYLKIIIWFLTDDSFELWIMQNIDMVDGFLRLPPTNKTDHHDITEILLKVALNTITLTLRWIIL
jgi:hypothetical protein